MHLENEGDVRSEFASYKQSPRLSDGATGSEQFASVSPCVSDNGCKSWLTEEPFQYFCCSLITSFHTAPRCVRGAGLIKWVIKFKSGLNPF